MVSAFFVIIYVASELPLVVPQRPPFCAVRDVIRVITFALAIALNYLTLWCRVYAVFYSSPILQNSIAKAARYLSYLSLILLLALLPAVCIIFLLSPSTVTTSSGCFAYVSIENQTIRWIMLAVCTVAVQIVSWISLVF